MNIITHPLGYTGTGGALSITVGIDPTSANAASMAISVQNIVNTFNALVATTGNLVSGVSNNIPAGQIDFESVALHELGHSLGLAHVNAASESGLGGSDQNYTKATDGANNAFDLGSGADGFKGSSDDARGDDVNLHWFRTSNNNPFTIAGTVDASTYARDTASLPAGHTFAANADRSVSMLLLGASTTEAVMQQGTSSDEAQRTLVHDGVATLRLAMAGLDEAAGTSDDYTIALTYAGLSAGADIVLDFDNNSGLASSSSNGDFLVFPTHVVITTTSIRFSDLFNWFFNDVSNTACAFSLSPTSVTVPAATSTGSVSVTAGSGCAWTAVSNDAWITVTGGASGTGDGTVSYSVATNTATSQRAGTVTIAGETFTVTQRAAFTDDPLTAESTSIKAVHFTELRTRINALRVGCELLNYSFTGTLTAGSTTVQAVHVNELRTALNEAFDACGLAEPFIGTISAGTVITAAQITAIRTQVVTLEG